MKTQWTAKALQRLQQIHDYLAVDQPENARRFIDRLTRKAAAIAENPLLGHTVVEYQRDDIREVFEGNYRIIYRVLPDQIHVLTVRHGARLLPTRLQDF